MTESDSSIPAAELRARIATLERLLAEQNERLARVEGALASTTSAPRADARNSPQSFVSSSINSTSPGDSPLHNQPAAASPRADLETRIGGRWLNRVGIVVCIFGIAFLIKYAFENEWVTPLMRVLTGVAGGAGALAGGEILRRRGYADYAHGLTGGGIVILYLATYAAFAFYGLIGQSLAFVLMIAVTSLAVLLAARTDALAVAVLALVGGFLTPVLLSTNRTNEIELFVYVALLDCGVLALAGKKGWRVLNLLAFVATTILFSAWLFTDYEPVKFTTAFSFLTLFFLIFASIPVLQNLIPRRAGTRLDAVLAIVNANFYYAAGYALLASRAESFRGALAIVVAGLYFVLGAIFSKRNPSDRFLRTTFAGIGAYLLAVAAAVQLDGRWVTVVWTVAAAGGLALGIRRRVREVRLGALALLGATILKIFLFDLAALDAFSRIVSFLVLGAALLGVSFLYQKRQRTEVPPAAEV